MNEDRIIKTDIASTVGGNDERISSAISTKVDSSDHSIQHHTNVDDQTPLLTTESIKQEIPPLESIGCSWETNNTELQNNKRRRTAIQTPSHITQYRTQQQQQYQHPHHHQQYAMQQPYHSNPTHSKAGFHHPTTPSAGSNQSIHPNQSPSSMGMSPASNSGVASTLGGYTTVADPMMQSSSFLPPRVETNTDCSLINEAGSAAASAIGRPSSAGPAPVSQPFYDPTYAGQPPATMGHCFGSSMMSQFNPMFGALAPMNFCTAPSMFWNDNSSLMMAGMDNPMYENTGEQKSEEKSEDTTAPESPNSSQGILDVDAVINGSRHGSVDPSRDCTSQMNQSSDTSSIGRARKRSRQESEEEVAGSIGGAAGSAVGNPAAMTSSNSFIGGGFDCMGSYPLGFGPPLCAPATNPATMQANPFYCNSLIPPNGASGAAGTSADISGYGAAAAVMAAGGMSPYNGSTSMEGCNPGSGSASTTAGSSRRSRGRDNRRMYHKKRRGGSVSDKLSSQDDESGLMGGSGGSSVNSGSTQPYNSDEEAGIHSPFPNSYVDSTKETEFARSSNVLFTQYCHARNSLYSQYVANSHAVKAMRLSMEDRQRYLTQFEVDAKIQERRYFNHFYALSKNQASPLTGVSLLQSNNNHQGSDSNHNHNNNGLMMGPISTTGQSTPVSTTTDIPTEDEKIEDGTLDVNSAIIESSGTDDIHHHDSISIEFPNSDTTSMTVSTQAVSPISPTSLQSQQSGLTSSSSGGGGISQSTLLRIGEYEKTERMKNRKKRTKKPKFSEFDVRVFADWYNMHLDNPYPSKQEKEMMAELTGLTKYQVSRWFCNARTRRPPPQRYESSKDGSLQPSQIPPQLTDNNNNSSNNSNGGTINMDVRPPNVLPKG